MFNLKCNQIYHSIKYLVSLTSKGSDSDIEWKLILIHPSRRNQLSTPNDAPKEWRLQLKYKGSHKYLGRGGFCLTKAWWTKEGVGVNTRLLRFGSSLSLNCVYILSCCEWKMKTREIIVTICYLNVFSSKNAFIWFIATSV